MEMATQAFYAHREVAMKYTNLELIHLGVLSWAGQSGRRMPPK
jgi:hypothetical protein